MIDRHARAVLEHWSPRRGESDHANSIPPFSSGVDYLREGAWAFSSCLLASPRGPICPNLQKSRRQQASLRPTAALLSRNLCLWEARSSFKLFNSKEAPTEQDRPAHVFLMFPEEHMRELSKSVNGEQAPSFLPPSLSKKGWLGSFSAQFSISAKARGLSLPLQDADYRDLSPSLESC